mmetsp:Transcript_4230/g.9128  ORF Transcript_4230/g.9128 Transcript_4230/m.9128 type:complete len:327 (+) Transcript_4230:29-1009(+)
MLVLISMYKFYVYTICSNSWCHSSFAAMQEPLILFPLVKAHISHVVNSSDDSNRKLPNSRTRNGVTLPHNFPNRKSPLLVKRILFRPRYANLVIPLQHQRPSSRPREILQNDTRDEFHSIERADVARGLHAGLVRHVMREHVPSNRRRFLPVRGADDLVGAVGKTLLDFPRSGGRGAADLDDVSDLQRAFPAEIARVGCIVRRYRLLRRVWSSGGGASLSQRPRLGLEQGVLLVCELELHFFQFVCHLSAQFDEVPLRGVGLVEDFLEFEDVLSFPIQFYLLFFEEGIDVCYWWEARVFCVVVWRGGRRLAGGAEFGEADCHDDEN